MTANDGFIIYGRCDATLNPGGVRIGTAEIYRQVEKIDEALESLCIAQKWDGDVRVVLFVMLRDGLVLTDELKDSIQRTIRENTTPRHVPKENYRGSGYPAHTQWQACGACGTQRGTW